MDARHCTPTGDEQALSGELILRPFKGDNTGALLRAKDGGTWVLSYRANSKLSRLEGKQVLARGEECEKQGEAYAGRHLDLVSLEEL